MEQDNNNNSIYKFTPIINKRRVVVYVEAITESEGKHFLAKEIKMKPEWIKSASLNTVDIERMRSNRFRPNYSTNPDTKTKPLSKHLLMSQEDIRNEKLDEITNNVLSLFNNTWHENYQNKITDYYWKTRREIIEERAENSIMKNTDGITILEYLDTFIAGFGSADISVKNGELYVKSQAKPGLPIELHK